MSDRTDISHPYSEHKNWPEPPPLPPNMAQQFPQQSPQQYVQPNLVAWGQPGMAAAPAQVGQPQCTPVLVMERPRKVTANSWISMLLVIVAFILSAGSSVHFLTLDYTAFNDVESIMSVVKQFYVFQTVAFVLGLVGFILAIVAVSIDNPKTMGVISLVFSLTVPVVALYILYYYLQIAQFNTFYY